MNTEYPTTGLEKNEIIVTDDGEIRLVDQGDTLEIGEMESLYEFEPHKDGTYTTENGIVIDLENFISEMAIRDAMAEDIKRGEPQKDKPDAIFTQRMHRFNGILYNRLRGKINKK